MNRFTTAAIFLLILAASVFAAGGALKPVTATEKGIETRTVTRAYQTDAAPEAATEPPESDSDQEELHTPEQAAAPPYTEETVTMCAKVVWAEARGIQSKAEQAAVIWCILNRYDAGIYGSSIEEVITAPHQFAYSEESPATAELIELADDVLQRWWAEKTGETNGRSSQGLPLRTFVVSTDITENRAFDEGNKCDFAASTLRAYLNGEFLRKLEDELGAGNICEYVIDLTADDGLPKYGKDSVKVGLLTMEDYRRHRDILPPTGKWWWTATPYSGLDDYNSHVRYVHTDGSSNNNNAYYGRDGVRPALYLKSEISVSVDDSGEDEQTLEQREMALYEAAVVKFGERAQILMAVEEMSELTKSLLKYVRHEDFNQGDYDAIIASVEEERADVSIMLNQLDVIFGDNSEAEQRKLEHLAAIVEDDDE